MAGVLLLGGPVVAAGETFHDLAVGAGGQLTGLQFADDGTLVVRNDTYGAHRWDSPRWTPLVTIGSLGLTSSQAFLIRDVQNPGVYEICICPTDSNIMYMMFDGDCWRSTNKGTNWARCAGWTRRPTSTANTNAKFLGRFMAVDPADSNVLYVGTASDGCFVTTNGGTTFAAVAAVGTATDGGGTLQQGGGHLIAFDRNSTVVANRTQIIYISTYGTGVYRSANGGSSWALTTSTPTTHRHMVCGQDGTVWHSDNSGPTTGFVRKYTGTWSATMDFNIGANNNRGHAIAVDPSNASRIVVGLDWGALRTTTNGGTSWFQTSSSLSASGTRTATDIPWLQNTVEAYMTNGDMAFDPTQSNVLGFAEGIGFWLCNPPSSDTNPAWTSQSLGIEQLVGNRIICPPGGEIVTISWDRPLFYKTKASIGTYPSAHGPAMDVALRRMWAGDYASSDPDYLAVLADAGSGDSSFSTDGGQTWTPFVSQTPGASNNGGCIAISTPTNMVWGSANGARPFFTSNGGTSWTQCLAGGVNTGWGAGNPVLNGQYISADRVAANTFLMVNSNSGGTPGVWRSTDSGANFTRVYTTHFPTSGARESIRHVPGNSGHAFYTAGDVGTAPTNEPASTQFFRTTDQGATWTALANILEVHNFGFGMPKPGGGGYPTIFILGYLSGVWGLYRSDDDEQASPTWITVGDGWPNGSIDFVKWIEGDPDVYKRVFYAFNGSGWGYYG